MASKIGKNRQMLWLIVRIGCVCCCWGAGYGLAVMLIAWI